MKFVPNKATSCLLVGAKSKRGRIFGSYRPGSRGRCVLRKHSPDGQQEMSRKNLVGDLACSSTREIIAYVYLRGKLNTVTYVVEHVTVYHKNTNRPTLNILHRDKYI